MEKRIYEMPEIRRSVLLRSGATLLSASIINNTTTTSDGQYIDHVYNWDDASNPFNHNWE